MTGMPTKMTTGTNRIRVNGGPWGGGEGVPGAAVPHSLPAALGGQAGLRSLESTPGRGSSTHHEAWSHQPSGCVQDAGRAVPFPRDKHGSEASVVEINRGLS